MYICRPSATSNGHVAIAGRGDAVPFARMAKFNRRKCNAGMNCTLRVPHIDILRSEKEARKFNAKILQRQTALENQVEQLSNALKDLTEQRRSSSVASPATTLHGSDQDPSGSSSNLLGTPSMQNKDTDHAGETGGVLRLEKDGESIYVGAGGSSWALQQVSLAFRFYYERNQRSMIYYRLWLARNRR
jgi:hypothetical protein